MVNFNLIACLQRVIEDNFKKEEIASNGISNLRQVIQRVSYFSSLNENRNPCAMVNLSTFLKFLYSFPSIGYPYIYPRFHPSQNQHKLDRDHFIVFFKWLLEEWLKHHTERELAFPYFSIPSKEYFRSLVRVVMVNKETNGWGEKEDFQIDDSLWWRLIDLYDGKINQNWDNLGSVWSMYYALRCLSEGDNPENLNFHHKVGFLQTNVALIGNKYGDYGYDSNIRELLVEACDRFFSLLQGDIILLSIGFGTETHTEYPYLKLIEETQYFGKLLSLTSCHPCNELYKLEFKNTKNIGVYGCHHPQGLSYRPIVEEMEKIIKHKLSCKGNQGPRYS